MSYLKKNEIVYNMPHLYFDKGKFTTNPNNVQKPLNFPISKEQLIIQRIKDWAFYLIIAALISYAVYRVLKGGIF